ncbi:hypothetical protein BJV74DRAFT_859076 [Russula compacta]|nr:hypothetical protein BJV74DRAFT_859076 [Russula compacta]
MGWATFTWFPLSTLVMGESEALDPAPVVLLEAPTYIDVAHVDRTRNWHHENVSINVPSDQSLRCTRADTTTYFSGPSAGEGSTVASSQTSRRQSDPNSCNIQGCGKKYVQLQGLRRHYQEKHAPRLCRYCGAFEWGRRYLLKKHIGERHPDIDLSTALFEVTRVRRRATT